MNLAPDKEMKMDRPLLTEVSDETEAEAFLRRCGTTAPTLHPNVHVPDLGYRHPYRWCGWNHTVATGVDAAGMPVVVQMTHYANGTERFSEGLAEAGILTGGKPKPQYPLFLLPAWSRIDCPEWTPGPDGKPIDPEEHNAALADLASRERRAGHVADWHPTHRQETNA